MADSPARQRIDLIAVVRDGGGRVLPYLEETCRAVGGVEGLACALIIVDDGSTDGSAERLDAFAMAHAPRARVVHLTRRFGDDAAITAGLDQSDADAVIVLDPQLRDDPAAIPDLVARWRAGCDVVYGVREPRQTPLSQRLLLRGFYRVLGWVEATPMSPDASDFALMDRCVVDAVRALPERARFVRGLRAWVGFHQAAVPVACRSAGSGQGRTGLGEQWRLTMNAVFSFSYAPLLLFRVAGLLALSLSTALILWALWCKLHASPPPAWTSLYITISFLGGVNLFGVGVLGEYVARIHDEVKARPNYVVSRGHAGPGAKETQR